MTTSVDLISAMFSKDSHKKGHTDPHALLGSQYLCAETPGSYQGLHLVSDDMAYWPTILLLQIFLAMHDVHAQATERRRRRRWVSRPILPAFLPLGNRRHLVSSRGRVVVVIGVVVAAATAALGGSGRTRGHDLFREDGELVDEVLGAEVAVEQLVRPAGRPRTLYEEGGERGGYLGCCGAPDGDVLRFGFRRRTPAAGEAVGGDVAEEEEFLARGVVPDEEGRGLVVAQRVVLAVQHGHRLDRNVRKDRSVPLVERQSGWRFLYVRFRYIHIYLIGNIGSVRVGYMSVREVLNGGLMARTGHREACRRHRPRPTTPDWAIFDPQRWFPGS